MSITKKIKDTWNNILRLIFLLMIFFIVLGVVFFIGISVATVKDYNQAITIWSTAIIASATLALLCFEYARFCKKTKSKVISAGENFFTATIFFIFSTLFLVGAEYLMKPEFYVKNYPISNLFNPLLLVLGIVLLIVAGASFAGALIKILDVLSKSNL